MPGVAASIAPDDNALPRQYDDAICALAHDASGRLVVGTASGEIQIDGDAPYPAHKGGVTRLCPHPVSGLLISAGEDGRVLMHDERESNQLLLAVNGWVEQMCWSPNGKLLAIAAGNRLLMFEYKDDGLHELDQWEGIPGVLAMAFAPNSHRLATAANKGLYVWRTGQEQPTKLLTFPGAAVSLAWQPNGKALAIGTQDGFLQVWRQQTVGGRSKSGVLTMRGYPGKLNCLAWHPKLPLLATAGGKDVVLWDVAGKNGKAHPLRDHEETITALAWSSDGKQLAAGDRGGRLTTWTQKGALQQTIENGCEIPVLAWSPGGQPDNHLYFGDLDGQLQQAGS